MESKTVKELRAIACELGIIGRWSMNKSELIAAIGNFKSKENIQEKTSNEREGLQKVTEPFKPSPETKKYVDNIEEGTIIAFIHHYNKTNRDFYLSGIVHGKNGSGMLNVESKKGYKYTVKPDNVIWVKTGTRWPAFVIDLFNKNKEV